MNSRSDQQAADSGPHDPSLPLAPPTLHAVLALLVPGLGHFLLGRRARAVAFAVLIFGCLAFGVAIDGRMPWTFGGSPLLILGTLGALGSGLPYLSLRFFGLGGDATAWGYDYGGAFIVTAGLMNLLLVLDAHDICWGKELVDPEVADGLVSAESESEAKAGEGSP